MFALDLFNTDHERRLTEGAVDTLEQRRIDDLAMKMDDLVARAKKATTPEVKQALMKEFQKCKDERDSYYKIREGEVTPTATGLKHRGTKGYGADYDGSSTGSSGTSSVAPSTGQRTMPRLDHDANDAPNYEVDEEVADSYNTKQVKVFKDKSGKPIGEIGFDLDASPGNDDWYCWHYATGYNVLGFENAAEATRELKYVHKHPEAVSEAGIPGNVPVEKIPGKEDLLKGKGRKYYEDQKKNSKEVSQKHIADPKIDQLLTKAHRERPKAKSDAEALAMKILDREQQDVERLSKENEREDRMIAKLANLEQNLQQQIDTLRQATDLNEDQRLHVGDPVIVTGANEFEGKTGEISEFSPSGKFVVVNLYNHGEHSMHLSDVKYNEYADQQDDWYDEEDYVEEDQGDGQVAIKAADDAVVDTMDGMAEGWSDAIVARRTGQPRTPYSVYIKGRKWKDFENDDHAEAVANKLRAKFKAEGRDPGVITIAPTDYDKGMDESATAPIIVPKRKKKEKPEPKFHIPYTADDYIPPALELASVEALDRTIADPSTKETTRELAKKAKAKKQGVAEAIVASGPSKPLDDRAVRKLVWDTMKINADTGDQAIQRALSVLAKKPQSRMVQDLQDKFQNLADRLSQGVLESGFSRDEEFLNRERNAGLEHETNNIQIAINGKPWKVVPGKGYADSAEERSYLQGMKRWAEKKSAATGKKWTVYLTGAAISEAQTDYSKRRAREKDIDAGKPVAKQRQPRMTDYQKRRAQDKKDMELGEDQDTSGVERAILNRIMVAHTDLLMKFGPEKVMQAAEEVAYNVGDVDEIGTSDVSAYVDQVKQILGAAQ